MTTWSQSTEIHFRINCLPSQISQIVSYRGYQVRLGRIGDLYFTEIIELVKEKLGDCIL